MKRFWDMAAASPDDTADPPGWRVLLDGKPVRLPGGAPLRLPGAALAQAVAEEWQAAGGARGGEMSYADVPLTRIVGAGQERVAAMAEAVILELAQYAESDLLCYRATHPPELVRAQSEAWDPWLDWAERRYGGRLLVTHGIVHIPQPSTLLAAFAGALSGLHPLALAALGILVPSYGSLVLGLAVADGALDAGAAHALSTLDERFQEARWGEDEQAAARRRQVGADVADAARVLRLLAA